MAGQTLALFQQKLDSSYCRANSSVLKINIKTAQILLATLLGASSWAQAADLLETLRAAQANDPVFAAARATLQAGLKKLPQGRALLMPNITASFTGAVIRHICFPFS